ncbi:MAG: alpha/beta fold hydrolase [Chloroflexota bacterium]|nr:MAG: alpha/beta fold hydrolase [Chloroflexota bacterium]
MAMSMGSPAAGDGVRVITISTPKGDFNVWTQRVGENPDIKVLVLHGGPGATHEYLANLGDHLPAAGFEIYFYDQLGSGRSDRPDEPGLWELDRFVDEVEQVRQALDLDRTNLVLYGHSWGGILAMEYSLRHQANLKALVVSNMMSSCPAYNAYAHDVLMPAMDQVALAEIKGYEARDDTTDPRYTELLMEHHYVQHVLRMPVADWPEPVARSFADINPQIYVSMQGPSELGMSGKLIAWDRTDDLGRIEVQTLVIGAHHDTMDPAFMRMMAGRFPNGRYLECPNGSHLAMWDDTETYFHGLIAFLQDIGPRRPMS